MPDKKKILITVKTYPHPSKSTQESVCTAGVSETGDWVRLYPIDYRYQPRDKQFEKYQWIEVELEKRPLHKDNRPESYQPDLDTLRILGEPISTKSDWRERRQIIDKLPHHTLLELKESHHKDKTSLGIVRPARVLDMEIREADPEWKHSWQPLFSQLRLFGPQQKPLRKLPFSFHYVFECEDDEKPHKAMCEDWELGTLFLKEADRLGGDRKAAESVKRKFLDELCDASRDTRFFMGTIFPRNQWLVLGVFYPPIVPQQELF